MSVKMDVLVLQRDRTSRIAIVIDVDTNTDIWRFIIRSGGQEVPWSVIFQLENKESPW